jgi:hypothetical protein
MMSGAETTGEVAGRVNDLSAMVSRDIGALKRRLYVILRTSYGGDRRAHPRSPVALKASAEFGGNTFTGFTGDISPGGALLVVSAAHRPVSGTGWVEFEGVGRIECEIKADNAVGLHLRFLRVAAPIAAALAARIKAATESDGPLIALTAGLAERVGATLNQALRDGAISREDLFDGEYVAIPGTDPVQVLAKHTALAEKLFPALIDPPLVNDPRVKLCVITDRNGYLAAHNRHCSQPQRPGERVWNTANSRNRRVFDDRTGILAARCAKPIVQTYCRDLGGGTFQMLKEMDAPIIVDGRRWGAVRLACEL